MKRPIFGTIALLILAFILMQSCSANYISSIIPGWHTALIPKMLVTRITGLWLAIVVAVYFLLLKKEKSNTITYTYLFMTLPLIFCDLLLLFDDYQMLSIYIPILCITIIPFIVAKIMFITKLFIYTIKNRN